MSTYAPTELVLVGAVEVRPVVVQNDRRVWNNGARRVMHGAVDRSLRLGVGPLPAASRQHAKSSRKIDPSERPKLQTLAMHSFSVIIASPSLRMRKAHPCALRALSSGRKTARFLKLDETP